MESTIGLYKTELIKPQRPWKTLAEIELATAEWIDWYNSRRLHGETGHVTPAEYEASYYKTTQKPQVTTTIWSLRRTRAVQGDTWTKSHIYRHRTRERCVSGRRETSRHTLAFRLRGAAGLISEGRFCLAWERMGTRRQAASSAGTLGVSPGFVLGLPTVGAGAGSLPPRNLGLARTLSSRVDHPDRGACWLRLLSAPQDTAA